jgi:hypothetical protein
LVHTHRPQAPVAFSRDQGGRRPAGAAGDFVCHGSKHGGERKRIDAIRVHQRLRHRIPEQFVKRWFVVNFGHAHHSQSRVMLVTDLTIAP